MNQVQLSLFAALFALLLVTLTQSSPLPDALSSRTKRQSADVRTAEYLAWIALGGKIPSKGCEVVACGVVDVYSRIRRSAADQRIAELQAQAALRQPKNRNMIGYGLYDIDAMLKMFIPSVAVVLNLGSI